MSGPTLEQRADQVRALRLALEVRCPDRLHFHAGQGVPCVAPSEEWPWGWVCLARIEHEISTRGYRDALRRRANAKRAQDGYEKRVAKRNVRRAAEAMNRVAAAARAARKGGRADAQEAPTDDHQGDQSRH